MPARRGILALALVFTCAGALFAQRHSGVLAQTGTGRTRVVHMAPRNPGVDVLLDGRRMSPDLTFRSASAYFALPAGQHMLQLSPTGATTPALLTLPLTVQAGQDQTVVALGLPPTLDNLVLTDDNKPPAAGMAKVRFVHAGADVPAVDIAVVGGPMLFQNVGFKGIAGPTEVPAGTYNLQVRATGTSTLLLQLPSVALAPGQIMTLFGAGLRSDNTLTVLALPYAAAASPVSAVDTTAAVAPTTPILAVAGAPVTGTGGPLQRDVTAVRWLVLLGLLGLGAAGSLWTLSRSA